MSSDFYPDFLTAWQEVLCIAASITFGVALFIFTVYKISLLSKKTDKEKFDLVSKKEIKTFLIIHILLTIALFLFGNTLQYEEVKLSVHLFYVRLFNSLLVSTLYGYVIYLLLKFMFPRILDKKLKRLRYTPRINPKTGNKMKLLSEAEEDVYLDEGMQAEEDVFSVDYDVWIEEATGDTKIEKYRGHLSALKCNRCQFQTLYLEKEEIIKMPTHSEDGQISKKYLCSYCGNGKHKNVVLSKKMKERSADGQLIGHPLVYDASIAMVKVEIQNMSGETKTYAFQNIDQTKIFLNKYNSDKLEDI